MAASIIKSKYYISSKISLIYLIVSSVYIIFSDHIIALIFNKTLSVEMLTTIETYKGLAFVGVTSVILFVLIQREIKAKRVSIHEFELQKQNLLNFSIENEKIKKCLQERNSYIETILKNLPIGLAVNKIDDGDTIYMNKNFTEIYGWPEKELDNLDSFFKNVYPDEEYRKMITERVLKDIGSGDPNKMRWDGIKITTGSGDKRIINAQNIPVFEQNLMISTVQDITKRKHAEETLRLNQSILSASQKIAKVGGWQWDVSKKKMYWTDEAFQIHDFNKEEFEMGSEELIEKSLSCYTPEDRKMIFEAFDKCIETGEKFEFTVPFKTAKGRNLWVHTSGEATLKNGEVKSVIGVIQDITEIKQAEKKLKNNEKRFRELVNNLNSGIVVHAPDTSIVFSNPKAVELLGLNNEQLLGKQAYDPNWNFLHEDNKPYTTDEFPVNQITNSKSTIINLTLGVVRPRTKDIIWLIVNGFPVLNNENEIKEIIISFIDITDQKNANTKLKKSEEKFRAIFENSLTAIFIADDKGDYISVNDAAVNLFGYTKEEFLNMNVGNLTTPSGDIKKKYQEYLEIGYEIGEMDFIIKTGEHRTGLYHAIRVSENFNLSIMMDITDLKNKERELERSELFLNETGQLTKVGGWDLDLKTMTPYFSKETYRIYDIPEGNPPRVEDGINFYAPEARKFVLEKVQQAIENHSSYDIEVPFITAKGKRIWVRTLGQVEVINGKAVRLYGAIQDITVNKESAIQLQESEEKYKLLAENTTDTISLFDTNGRFLYVSPSIKNISGYEPSEVLGKKSYVYFHPDDIKLVTSDDYWNKLKAGQSILLIYRFKSKDGKYGWFESSRQPILNDKNKLVKIVSVSREISDRIEREKVIENYNQSLKKLTIEISLVEEKQRKEIAANIHDHLSQLLVISRIKLTDLINEISNPNSVNELKSVVKFVSEALENTRKITYDLSPPVLYELGLIETLYWLAEKTEKEYNIKTLLTTDLTEVELSEPKLILIFRVIQELVNNSIKHAQAKNLEIKIKVINEILEIIVSDDGKGFNTNTLTPVKIGGGGFGLFAVKERVQNLNGTISIHSEKNKGTTLKIDVPLE